MTMTINQSWFWNLDHSVGSGRLPPGQLRLLDVKSFQSLLHRNMFLVTYFHILKSRVLSHISTHFVMSFDIFIDLDAGVSHREHFCIPRRRRCWKKTHDDFYDFDDYDDDDDDAKWLLSGWIIIILFSWLLWLIQDDFYDSDDVKMMLMNNAFVVDWRWRVIQCSFDQHDN